MRTEPELGLCGFFPQDREDSAGALTFWRKAPVIDDEPADRGPWTEPVVSRVWLVPEEWPCRRVPRSEASNGTWTGAGRIATGPSWLRSRIEPATSEASAPAAAVENSTPIASEPGPSTFGAMYSSKRSTNGRRRVLLDRRRDARPTSFEEGSRWKARRSDMMISCSE
jgi:hypothetical protein